MALVCVGVIGLGVVEAHGGRRPAPARQEAGNCRYAKSVLALVLPIAYCVLDAVGTFADTRVLETPVRTGRVSDRPALNCAYELTFLLAGIACFVYVVLIRKQKLVPEREAPKYAGAVFETAGQFAYIYALADTDHVAMSAPIISAYCVAVRAVEPHFPEGKALLEALSHDRPGGGGHRHPGRVRRVTAQK